MEKIPIRHISEKVPGGFDIRKVDGLDMVEEVHRHSFFFALALEKGAGEHIIDFVSYPVGDHSVFFVRPGQVHRLVLESGCRGYLMRMSSGFYRFRRAGRKNAYSGEFKRLFAVLADIFEEYTEKRERFQEVIKAGLDIFFIELSRQGAPPLEEARAYTQERLETLLSLIETNMSDHLQVADYAKKMNLTTYQLNAVTKGALGKTCSEVISDCVVLEAKRRLLATTMQVSQIAWDLGYEDVSYFIRFFKKNTAFSPEAFRNKFR